MSYLSYTMRCSSWNLERISCFAPVLEVNYFSKARKSFAARPEKNVVANAGPSDTSHRNLAIRLISAHGTASASTLNFLLDEWPILNFFFEVDFCYRRSGKLSLFLLLRPNPLPNLRTTSEAMFTQNCFQMVLDQTRSVHVGPFHLCASVHTGPVQTRTQSLFMSLGERERRLINSDWVRIWDRYRSGPVPVHF